MTRRRWRLAILSALATLAATYPVTTLFSDRSWFPQAAVIVGLVAVVGLVMRPLTGSRMLVVLVQVLIVGWVVVWQFAGSTFSWFLPTRNSWLLLGSLLEAAYKTIQDYSAPAPLVLGVTFSLLAIVGALAICVDAMAATFRAPAAAGLPLLTAYLITASNGSEPLAIRYFALPVAVWLIMLHLTARSEFGTWGTTASGGQVTTEFDGRVDSQRPARQARRAFTAGAARLGMAGLVLALAVPVAMPHFPPRYLAEGLGRGGTGNGTGTVGFNDTVDLTQSLRNTDETPVLRYSTDGNHPPLRVLATAYYSHGEWRVAGQQRSGLRSTPQPPRTPERRDYTMVVTDNHLRSPRIAAPYPVVAVSMPGTPWRQNPATGDILVSRAVSSYRITYADTAPLAAQLREAGPPEGPDVDSEDLALPDTIRDSVIAWSNEVAGGQSTELDKAIAIQNHLRDTRIYTYSLDLGDPRRDAQGRILDPLTTFRLNKVGYCTQFATAMIMMARAQGIPARMAIGFLPGEPDGDQYLVRASDAHAWPELYFAGFGWLRFEPTPGSRSGNPPAYAVPGSGSVPAGAGQEAVEPGATRGPSGAANQLGPDVSTSAEGDAGAGQFDGVLSLRGLVILTAIVILLLGLFVMPLTAWFLRGRRRRAAVTQQDLVEIEWDDLAAHLRDLGLTPPEGGSLRTWREHYIRDGHLDRDNASAMRRITATLEKARYDRPERTTPAETEALRHDIRRVRRQVGRTRAWSVRLQALMWPQAGVAAWRRLRERIADRRAR